MRRRVRDGDPNALLNLDSFMDIITIIIGALFFVVIYMVLSSSGALGKVKAPIIVPGNTEPVFFECRNNTVFFPDIDGLQEKLWTENPPPKDSDGILSFLKKLVNAEVTNDYYSLKAHPINDNGLRVVQTFSPLADARGENSVELNRKGSVFRQKLAKLDPLKDHLFILVRNDSFEVFHAVRREAMKHGFRAGWEPLKAEASLTFGGRGNGIVNARNIY